MSTPEPERYGLDPISEAIGELRADVRTLTREVATLRSEMATKAELRAWGAIMTLLIGAVLAKLLHG